MQAYCPAPNPPNHARRNTLGALRRWRGASGSMNGGRERGKFWRKFGGPEGEREPSARGARGIRSLSLGSSPGFIVENTSGRGLQEQLTLQMY